MIFGSDYDNIIPIGSNCRVGLAMKELGIRKMSLPFDWMLTTMKSINEIIKNDFEDFYNEDVCTIENFKMKNGYHQYVLNRKYNLNITHENSFKKQSLQKYERRINRFYEIINKKDNKVLFVRNLLDGIIYDELHSYYLKTEKNYSDFDVKHIINFNNIIRNKFPNLNFDILVINHTNPLKFFEKNIYNITSSITQNEPLWDQKACKEALKNINLKK
jgi:hypothetical protein